MIDARSRFAEIGFSFFAEVEHDICPTRDVWSYSRDTEPVRVTVVAEGRHDRTQSQAFIRLVYCVPKGTTREQFNIGCKTIIDELYEMARMWHGLKDVSPNPHTHTP